MTPQELKNSILQLAIQGKLVEQRPEEGTAEELYRQIQEEKRRLVKEGKIKKEKPLPEIAEDEKPFEIPGSWKWVKLGNVASVLGGKRIPAGRALSTENTGYRYIRVSDMKNGSVLTDGLLYVPQDIYPSISRYIIHKEDIYITVAGTIGKVGKVPAEIDGANLTENADRLVFSIIDQGWLIKCLETPYVQSQIVDVTTKVGQPKLAIKRIQELIFPLPPLAEQKRIVAKIEALLPYIDRYEQAWNRLEALNKRFPEDMKKSLLQYAIEGKLVEQRPEEGTAEELYQQIQEEKRRLVKEGKIKKEKPLPEIAEDEVPFEIPRSWKWVRVGQIFGLQAGKNITAADIYDQESPKHSYPCYGGNGLRGFVSTYNRKGHFALIGRQGALCGNINFAESRFYATEHAVVVEHYGLSDVIWSGWFLRALNLNQYATATAQPGLAVANIAKIPMPLPPLAEQKRIVAKLEELLPLCEQLK